MLVQRAQKAILGDGEAFYSGFTVAVRHLDSEGSTLLTKQGKSQS